MSIDRELVRIIKQGGQVAGAKILERRTRGFSAIRQQFLARLKALSGIGAESSLMIRWRRLGDLANSRTVLDGSFELVLHSGTEAVTGSFPDRWILCYPEDAEVKTQVDAVLDQMCRKAVNPAAT
jgi:hypothetical protein